MPKFLAPIDLAQNELQNARIQNLATAPSSPVAGQQYFDTVANAVLTYDGTAWVSSGAQLTTSAASTQAMGDSASAGSATTAARADHKHAMPAFGSVTAQTSFGASSANGSSADVARADHTHGTPAHDAAAHAAIKLSDLAAPSTTLSMGSQVVSNVATPVTSTDAANKGYVDSVAQGLDVKQSVRVATTTAGTLATSFADGETVDGITLATGDRILIKNQSSGSENGVYVVAASGAPTRAADFNSSDNITAGAFMFVESGTANADTGWVLTTTGTITPGTTSLTFAQFSGAGTYIAGNGLSLTGGTFAAVGTTNRISVASGIDIASTYAGQTSISTLGTITTGTWTGTTIAVANGGTGATSAADAKTNLGFVGRYAASVGNNSATSFTVTHNLGTQDVIVQVYTVSSGVQVQADVTNATTNTVTVAFATAPTTNQYRVVVIG